MFKFKDLKKYWEENGYFYPWKKQWDYTRKYVTPVFLPEDNTDFSITKYEDEDVVKNINIIFNKLENGEKISAFDYENKLSNKLYFSEEHCKLINYARTEIYNATMINIYKENSMEPGSSYKYDYCLSLEINADEETKTFKLDRSYKCKFVIDNKICINIGSFLKMMSEHEEKNIYVMLNVLEYWLRNSNEKIIVYVTPYQTCKIHGQMHVEASISTNICFRGECISAKVKIPVKVR